MKNKTFVIAAFAALALAWLTAAPAFAQLADHRTFFTFSSPVAIPGVTLPAGKYLFRTADGRGDIVQVLSADGKTPYAAFFIYRVNRSEPAGDPEVRFMETAAGMPHALRAWWYPGVRSGYEFVYPKEQARLLAKGTQTPVLTTASAALAPTPPAVLEVSPSGKETPVAENATAAQPTGEELKGEIAPPSIAVAEPVLEARAALPRTASAMPLVGLAGLMLLVAAAFIRGWRLTF
jgi:hypothetical protein